MGPSPIWTVNPLSGRCNTVWPWKPINYSDALPLAQGIKFDL